MVVRLGGSCSGFITMDEDVTHKHRFQWARVLVKSNGVVMPKMLLLVMGCVFHDLTLVGSSTMNVLK